MKEVNNYDLLVKNVTDHCIICLRRLSTKRKRTRTRRDTTGSGVPVVAPESVISTPGYLTTFNQIWAVFEKKWKKNNSAPENVGNETSSEEIGISLENVLQSDRISLNVSFSTAPTICEVCCDKVLAVENLMKAVRQQVREVNILLEEGRRRQDGGLGEFEKSLREKELEEPMIRAILLLVGISYNIQDGKGEDDSAVDLDAVVKMECEEEETSLDIGHDDMNSDTNNEELTMAGDDDGDLAENLKSEPEPEEADNELVEENGDDKSDPDFKVKKRTRKKVVPDKQIKRSSPRKLKNQPGSKKEVSLKMVKAVKEKEVKGDDLGLVYPCSCDIKFSTPEDLLSHKKTITKEKTPHPKFFDYVNRHRQPCEMCGKQVAHSDILEHLTDHLNGQHELVIRCPNEKCRCMFVTPKGLQYHLHRDRSKMCKKMGEVKSCEICGFKGRNIMKIRNHVRDKHENGKEKKWKCPISGCGKMFFIKQSVQFHLVEHRYRPPPITQQVCDKCGESFEGEEMEGHLKDKHGVNEVIGCKQCGFKFSGRDEMLEHLFEGHRDVGYLCDICEDKQLLFKNYNVFREHYFEEHKLCPKRYKCGEEDCNKWFWRSYGKEEHELRMHREGAFRTQYVKSLGQKFECDGCKEKFVTEEKLLCHKIRVHGVDPFTCDGCGQQFDEKGKFNRHKKEHAGVAGGRKEWRCEVDGCGKVFGWRVSWKRHVEGYHATEKRHICEDCGKGFAVVAGLKKHRDSVHLGMRKYVCEECGDRFYSGTTLKNHKMIHRGERPFGCEICGQRFRQEGVLRRHKIAHEEKGAGFRPNGPMKQIRKRIAKDYDLSG